MVAYSVYTTLPLLHIEKYFSLSLLVWLLVYVGLCFSAYTAVNSECMHIKMVGKPCLSDVGRHETKYVGFCLHIRPLFVALISFSCQDAFLESSFVDAVGFLRIRRKHILLLYKQRVSVCIRIPSSELRVAPLFLDIQGEQHCYGNIPDIVILIHLKRDSQNMFARDYCLLFSIAKNLNQ